MTEAKFPHPGPFRPLGWGLLQVQDPVLIALAAVAITSGMDAAIKGVAVHYPLLMILFWRFVIGTLLVAMPFFASGRRLPSWRATRFHLLRGLIHAVTALVFFFAVTQIPLAEATVLVFTSVLMTAPLERLFLKEPVRPVSVLAALVGFAGVVIIARADAGAGAPGTDPMLGRGAALTAAAGYALTIIMLRARAATDGTWATAVYTNVTPALWMAVPALILEPLPPVGAWPVFAAVAVLGSSVWVLFSMAYARAPAHRLVPLDYTALIWAVLFGWIFFAEIPSASLAFGATAIIGGCLLTAFGGRGPVEPEVPGS